METLMIAMVGIVLAALEFRTPAPNKAVPSGPPAASRRRTSKAATRREWEREREENTHARRMAWLAEVLRRGEDRGDLESVRLARKLSRAEEERHVEKLRRLGDR